MKIDVQIDSADRIEYIAIAMCALAARMGCDVGAIFNGVDLRVSPTADAELLIQDYRHEVQRDGDSKYACA